MAIVAPGFSADCLETLEELDGENREIFMHNGGEDFAYLPCLNDSDGGHARHPAHRRAGARRAGSEVSPRERGLAARFKDLPCYGPAHRRRKSVARGPAMPISLGFDIFVVAFVFLVVVTIAMGVRTVPQGYAYTVERFGRYSRTLGPGLGLIVPYVEQIGKR